MDDSPRIAVASSNALRRGSWFLRALTGWHEALDAKAFQLEQTAAQVTTSALVLLNGLIVASIVIAVFLVLIQADQRRNPMVIRTMPAGPAARHPDGRLLVAIALVMGCCFGWTLFLRNESSLAPAISTPSPWNRGRRMEALAAGEWRAFSPAS